MRRVSAAALATSLVGGLPVAPASAVTSTTLSWNYDGTNGADGIPQLWIVPPDVYSATFSVFGAEGGAAAPGWAPGALGGAATATVAVTPGELLEIDVGGQPEAMVTGPAASSYIPGGFNGGGDGGSGGAGSFGLLAVFGIQAGYGGGASGVYTLPYVPADALVVAGGGGGIGSLGSAGAPGAVAQVPVRRPSTRSIATTSTRARL